MAPERPLLPLVQGMLLRVPLRSHRPFARPLPGLHLRLPRVSGESTTLFLASLLDRSRPGVLSAP